METVAVVGFAETGRVMVVVVNDPSAPAAVRVAETPCAPEFTEDDLDGTPSDPPPDPCGRFRRNRI